ncbi:hypothetical protein VSDG_01882 [Cytospora chrysosperma]|uniref:CID domain-containing protein n=1 Tax=Cytospora chrysosperma TaxID=252740 RepID=A0A423WHH2_CYTCH|nr:hypothetical protein VSDG_01882 [Valsa sordida]
MASASAQLGIAKASLLAALLKADAGLPSCSRDDIEQFHGLLSAAVAQCSPTNVQKCKQWTLQHLVPSPARVAALGKYLVAFANSLGPQQPTATGGPKKGPGPSVKRKRLHILYILNDVIFHLKFRAQNQTFPGEIESHLPALFRSAAAFTNAPKHERKLKDLVQLWEEKSYFAGPVLEKLRAAVAEGPRANDKEANGADATPKKATKVSSAREAPFMLPSMHGDTSTPWYDLPAANWLPVIEPNSTRPMNPSMIKPLQLAGGPADKNLVDAVKKLLGDVDKIYAKDTRLDGDLQVDISQMGETIERDELGDIVGGETYYGCCETSPDIRLAREKHEQGWKPRPVGQARPELGQQVPFSEPGWEELQPAALARLVTLATARPFSQPPPPQPPFQPNWPVPPPPPPPPQHHQQQQQQPQHQQYPPPQPGGFDGWNVPPPPPPPPPPQYPGHGHWPPPPPLGMPPAGSNAGQPPQGWFPPSASGSPVPAPPPPPGSWGGGWGPPPPPSSGPPPQPGGGGRGGGYGRGRGW